MLDKFPRMQKFTLAINYRNAREVAEHYLAILSQALPAKPSADVPVFEAGEVVQRQVKRADLNDVLAGILRRLLQDYAPREVGGVILGQGPEGPQRSLAERKLPVSSDADEDVGALAPLRSGAPGPLACRIAPSYHDPARPPRQARTRGEGGPT